MMGPEYYAKARELALEEAEAYASRMAPEGSLRDKYKSEYYCRAFAALTMPPPPPSRKMQLLESIDSSLKKIVKKVRGI